MKAPTAVVLCTAILAGSATMVLAPPETVKLVLSAAGSVAIFVLFVMWMLYLFGD